MKHKVVEYVNPRNHERWDCTVPEKGQILDGIEFIYVHRPGKQNEVRLMRKGSLVRAPKNK